MIKQVEKDTPKGDDLDRIGSYIVEMYNQRKNDRRDFDKYWDEVERQLRMEPEAHLVKLYNSKDDTKWIPLIEMPWQAETHELLTADEARLQWPDDRPWFKCSPDDDENVLDAYIETLSQSIGEEVEVNGKNVAHVVESAHLHFQNLYGFRDHWNWANGDAFTYGHMVLRAGIGILSANAGRYRGVTKDREIPMLCHVPARSLYLDESESAVNRNGMVLGPIHIIRSEQRADDLRMAMKKGVANPEDEVKGGWVKGALDGFEVQDKDLTLLEAEGDLVVPDSGATMIFRNVRVNVVVGTSSKAGKTESFAKVYRFRHRSLPFSSLMVHHYHRDQPDCAYGTSPLLKGRVLQKMGSSAATAFSMAAILNARPPVRYDRSDAVFAKQGGPRIFPGAFWGSIGAVEPVYIGEVAALQAAFQATKEEYQDVTGTNAPRLGQQTKSHQTAFAVDTEVQRSVARTVDFHRSLTSGPMLDWLYMENYMLRHVLRRGARVFVKEYESWLDVGSDMIPERCQYSVTGAAEPIEDREEEQKQMAALQQLAQADQMAVQLGFQPSDWDAIRKFIAKEGFGDAEIFQPRAPAQSFGGLPEGTPGTPNVPGTAQGSAQDALAALATGTVPRTDGA